MPTVPVNTKSAQHRKLRLNNIADLRAELARTVAAENAGTLRTTGSWTVGQTFNHLATWINFGYDGFPSELRPPLVVKIALKLLKGRFLRSGLPRGVKIGKISGGTLGIEPTSTSDGLARLNTTLDRAKKSPPAYPSPVFGMMSHDEYIRGTLRHAELHLGSLHP